MSKLSRRKAGRSDVPGPLTSTQKFDADLDEDDDEEVGEKYVARGRRPPGDRDEELFQKQLDEAIRQSTGSTTCGQIPTEDLEPQPGPSGLQQRRRAAASAAAAKKAWMEDSKDDTRDDDTEGEALLPDKASTESKDSKVETLKQEAADNSNQKGNSVQQTVALKPIDPKMPTIKINLTKQTVSSAGLDGKESGTPSEDTSPGSRTPKRKPVPSKKKRAAIESDDDDDSGSEFDANDDADAATDDEFAPTASTSSKKSNKLKSSRTKRVPKGATDPASVKKADPKPDDKSLASNSNSNSSGGRTRRPSASKRKIQIDFEDDDDKPASDVKVSTESHPVNDKALTIKEIPPEAKGDANSSPPEKAAPPVAPSTGGGRTKRTLKVKKKLVESSDDDDSDFDGGTEDGSGGDEFAPPAKKKACKTAPATSKQPPAKTSSSSKTARKPVARQSAAVKPGLENVKPPPTPPAVPKMPARSFSAPKKFLAGDSACSSPSERSGVGGVFSTPSATKTAVLTPKWTPPAMIKSASSPATPSSGAPVSLIGMRLGLSRNLKTKPLHSNVKWNGP